MKKKIIFAIIAAILCVAIGFGIRFYIGFREYGKYVGKWQDGNDRYVEVKMDGTAYFYILTDYGMSKPAYKFIKKAYKGYIENGNLILEYEYTNELTLEAWDDYTGAYVGREYVDHITDVTQIKFENISIVTVIPISKPAKNIIKFNGDNDYLKCAFSKIK